MGRSATEKKKKMKTYKKKVVAKPVAEEHSKDLSVDGRFKKTVLQK